MVGHNNWFKVSTDPKIDNSKTAFSIEFELPSNAILDFSSASDQAAQLIASNYQNLHLSMSGGLDSEYVAKVLLRNKIPFIPVILIVSDSSYEEYSYVWYFCQQNNLTPVVFDYRDKFLDLSKQLIREAHKLKVAPSFGFIPNVISNQLPGASIITGNGEPFFNSSLESPMGEMLEFAEYEWYFDVTMPQHPGAFFTYTPDLFLSLITSIDTTIPTQLSKAQLYDVAFRPKNNWHRSGPTHEKFYRLAKKYQKSPEMYYYRTHKETVLNII